MAAPVVDLGAAGTVAHMAALDAWLGRALNLARSSGGLRRHRHMGIPVVRVGRERQHHPLARVWLVAAAAVVVRIGVHTQAREAVGIVMMILRHRTAARRGDGHCGQNPCGEPIHTAKIQKWKLCRKSVRRLSPY